MAEPFHEMGKPFFQRHAWTIIENSAGFVDVSPGYGDIPRLGG
jgi:hypothetical protein